MRSAPVLLLVALLARSAHAADTFSAQVETYADDDKTTVVRPSVAAAKDIAGGVAVNVAVAVDQISTASVDVITNATQPSFTERRTETTIGTSWTPHEGTSLALSMTESDESDYFSRAFSLRGSHDFFQHNLSLSVRLGKVNDTVYNLIDDEFAEPLDGYGASFGVAQTVTPTLILHGGYEAAWLDGYMSSPYRNVRFGDYTVKVVDGFPVFENVTVSAQERHPSERRRHAAYVGAAWHLGAAHALQPRYRFYLDDWGILSHEAELLWFWEATPNLTLRSRGRFYAQSAADFYRAKYEGAPADYEFFTMDKRTGAMRAWLIGERAELTITDGRPGETFQKVGLDAKLELSRNQYLDNLFISERMAIIAQLGIFAEL